MFYSQILRSVDCAFNTVSILSPHGIIITTVSEVKSNTLRHNFTTFTTFFSVYIMVISPTSFPGLSYEDEARHEKALVWAGHVTTKNGSI
jgi:hypothetical protein